MPVATLDVIESRRNEIYNRYSQEVGTPDCCGHVDLKVHIIEEGLKSLYEFVRKESKNPDLTPRDLVILWESIAKVCDVFIAHVQMLNQSAGCPVDYDKMLDVRLKSQEKADFHKTC